MSNKNFWEAINDALEQVVGPKEPNLETDQFPGNQDLMDQAAYAQGGQGYSPDAAKEALQAQGYVEPVRESPFQNDTAQILDIVGKQPSPFTIIDLTPSEDGGTTANGGVNFNGIGAVNNRFPASGATIAKIASILNTPQLQILRASRSVAPGVTYEFGVVGNSLRIERLAQGFRSVRQENPGAAASSFGESVNTDAVVADTMNQNALAMLLSGCFIQFESLDAPMFFAKPGEVYNVSFSTIFVTVFGSGGRWRLISGSNAKIIGKSDDRALRSDMSIWDGGGLLDNPLIHPVPFAMALPLTTPLTITPGGGDPAYSAAYANLLTNYDDGSGLSLGAGGNTIGRVINRGYVIAWINSLTWTVLNGAATGNMQIQLKKIIGQVPQAAGAVDAQIALEPYFVEMTRCSVTEKSKTINFAKPIRVVLAGFDQQTAAAQGLQPGVPALGWPAGTARQTGETLIAEVASADAITYAHVSVSGYIMGSYSRRGLGPGAPVAVSPITPNSLANPIRTGIIPFNPYPQDCKLFLGLGF